LRGVGGKQKDIEKNEGKGGNTCTGVQFTHPHRLNSQGILIRVRYNDDEESKEFGGRGSTTHITGKEKAHLAVMVCK